MVMFLQFSAENKRLRFGRLLRAFVLFSFQKDRTITNGDCFSITHPTETQNS